MTLRLNITPNENLPEHSSRSRLNFIAKIETSGVFWNTVCGLCLLTASVNGAIVVAANGSGNYRDLQSAIDSISSQNTSPAQILIKPGNYYGHVSIPASKSSIAFIGQGAAPTNTLITWSVSSIGGNMEHSTLSIYATNLSFENLAIQNTWPVNQGQANAMTSSGGAAFNQFKNVWILSTQDTIYLQGGPLQGWTDTRESETISVASAITLTNVLMGWMPSYALPR